MFQSVELITPTYTALQRSLHETPEGYGGKGDKWAGVVVQLAAQYRCCSLLDYGCGQGSLVRSIRALELPWLTLREYDPAISGKDALPAFADMVSVTDVLEHVEPECLDRVLKHVRKLARRVIWCVICTQESQHILKDGRNAHLTIHPGGWWKQKLKEAGFTLHPRPTVVRAVAKEFSVILTP